MPPVHTIQSAEAWQECLRHLQQVDRIALDLESNGLFAYREQICLVQISTDVHDFIVDPFVDLDWEPFGRLIADPAVEKVLHASEYDLILLKRRHNWDLHNLFDTMWAARILGYDRIGLASMLEALYGIHLSKTHQRADWSQRPLKPSQLAYAQADTHHLLPMRDDLALRLEEEGCAEEAAEIFAEQARVRLPDVDFDAEDFWSINGALQLTPRGRAILRELHILRDREARRRNVPPFKVLSNQALLSVAEAAPTTPDGLRGLRGLSASVVGRYGAALLQAVAQGVQAPIPRRPRAERPADAVLRRYERLQNWRKERATQRGVASDVILSREAMWELARLNPRSTAELLDRNILGPWRAAAYGAEILHLLQ